MHKDNGRYYYSPTDLKEFLASSFATWMSRSALDSLGQVQPDPEPLSLTTLAERARKHEQTCLAQLRQEGREVHTLPADMDRVEATIRAMRAGHEVIYHGRLCEEALPHPRPQSPSIPLNKGEARQRRGIARQGGGTAPRLSKRVGSSAWRERGGTEYFLGRPDFLVRTAQASALGNYDYEVWDVTLATQPSPAQMMQLCCSVDLLRAVQGQRSDSMLLWLGSGEQRRFRTADFIYYYLALKQAFLAYMQHFDPAVQPSPELGGDYGRWTAQATRILETADHLSRVADISVSQIQKLNTAGITTLTALAEPPPASRSSQVFSPPTLWMKTERRSPDTPTLSCG